MSTGPSNFCLSFVLSYKTFAECEEKIGYNTEEMAQAETPKKSDLNIYYDDEPLNYLFPLYNEVAEKYFRK
jgi:hypothetical protein